MAAASAPGPLSPAKFSRPIVLTIGAGGGAAITGILLQLGRSDAAPLLDAIEHWGPLFVIVLVLLVMGHSALNTWGERFVTAAVNNATAMQSMADALQRISGRDDERERERELAMDHLASTTQKILAKVESIEERCSGESCIVPAKQGGGAQ